MCKDVDVVPDITRVCFQFFHGTGFFVVEISLVLSLAVCASYVLH